MAKRKDISIKFIAEQCGISIATVSRVLNNDSKVAPQTKKKVLDMMSKYNYVMPTPSSNHIAKVGIIYDTEISDYYMSLIMHLSDTMKKNNFQVIQCSLGHDESNLNDALATVYDCNVVGLFLITCGYNNIKDKLDPKVSHVWIDCNDEYEVSNDICQVQSDHYYSGQLAAQELIKQNCKNPVILMGAHVSHRTKARISGFTDEFKKQGIFVPDDHIMTSVRTVNALAETSQLVRYLISTGFHFDSIFTLSDWRTLGAYQALTEQGIDIPGEVKLIGFDGISVACIDLLHITCIQQNIEAICLKATELMLGQINHEPITLKYIVVPTRLLLGKTV